MAVKRSAQPPPAESSSGETVSGSDTDESDEEIAHSPPSVATKNAAPPPQKVQKPEASDEEEGEGDEEGESEEEEEEGEEEEEEGEEEDKANHTAPSSATKDPPPPPPKREEAESEEEDEEEADDGAPQPVSAPKQEAEGKGGKPPPSSSEDKKPTAPFQRSWSKDDEVRILESLAAHRRDHGTLPPLEDLEAALAGNLDNSGYGLKELTAKVKNLKGVYTRTVKRGDLPSKDVDRRIFALAKEVWGGGDRPASGTSQRDFGEMCQVYPFLGEELKDLDRTQPGLFKREFNMIHDEKARALDFKIKKQRLLQMKLMLRGHEVDKDVIKTLVQLLD